MKNLKRIMISIIAVVMCFVMVPQKVLAEDTTDVIVKAKCQQTIAREMWKSKLVEEFRNQESNWYWNEDNTEKVQVGKLKSMFFQASYEELAEQRAAEIALYYSHTRPDGTALATISPWEGPYWKTLSENIAIGYDSAEEVMNAWKAEDKKYEGQTERRNILDPEANCYGTAYTEIYGLKIWVMIIGWDGGSGSVYSAPIDTTRDITVKISNSLIKEATMTNTPVTCDVGDSVEQPKLNLNVLTTQPINNTPISCTTNATWTSSNPAIAAIEDQKIVGKGEGRTALTATALNKTYSLDAVVGSVVMNRLYNPNSGEHFYTAKSAERDMLVGVGWKFEGTGWYAPKNGKDVYRLYNPNAGDHHYTLNEAEKDMLVKVGWNDEGVGWCSDVNETTPLFREYNPNADAGAHNYTTNKAEHNMLVGAGWHDEGFAWYGM